MTNPPFSPDKAIRVTKPSKGWARLNKVKPFDFTYYEQFWNDNRPEHCERGRPWQAIAVASAGKPAEDWPAGVVVRVAKHGQYGQLGVAVGDDIYDHGLKLAVRAGLLDKLMLGNAFQGSNTTFTSDTATQQWQCIPDTAYLLGEAKGCPEGMQYIIQLGLQYCEDRFVGEPSCSDDKAPTHEFSGE